MHVRKEILHRIFSVLVFGVLFVSPMIVSAEVLWSFSGPGSPLIYGMAQDIAIDGNDNSYVVGSAIDTSGTFVWIEKRNSNGTLVWTRTSAGIFASIESFHTASAVEVSPDSNSIYLTGWVNSKSLGILVLQKYDATGSLVWSRTYTSPNHSGTLGVDLAVDSNAVFVAAQLSSGFSGNPGVGLLKYGSDGSFQLSVTMFTGVSTAAPFGHLWKALHVRLESSRIYWATAVRNQGVAVDWIRVTDSSLNEIWTRTYEGGSLLGFDVSGTQFVRAGISSGGGFAGPGCTLGATRLKVALHDVNGDEIWSIPSSTAGSDYLAAAATAAKIDNIGNIYLGGFTSRNLSNSYDLSTFKVSPSGQILWTCTAKGTQLAFPTRSCYMDWITGLAIDSSGNPIASGRTGYPSFSRPTWVGKFSKDGPSLKLQSIQPQQNLYVDLLLNTGNGYFNPRIGEQAIARIIMGIGGALKARVFNLAHEEIATLHNNYFPAGMMNVVWDGRNKSGEFVASGLYFIRIEGAGKSVTKKVLVKK